MNTRSPSPTEIVRPHYHCTQVQPHPRSVTPFRVDPRYRPTSVCPPHHNHTREILPGAPPDISVVGLASFIRVGSQRATLSQLSALLGGIFGRNFTSSLTVLSTAFSNVAAVCCARSLDSCMLAQYGPRRCLSYSSGVNRPSRYQF